MCLSRGGFTINSKITLYISPMMMPKTLVTEMRFGSTSIAVPGERGGVYFSKVRTIEMTARLVHRGPYTVGGTTFDALIFGYYEGSKLVYAARTRNGLTPKSRVALMRRFRELRRAECPFANLPEKLPGRWGQGLTTEKMADCRWLEP